jgi:peptidase M48-like protein
MQTTRLNPAIGRPLAKPAPTPYANVDKADVNELLSYISGPQDLVQIRTPSKGEERVQALRTVLNSRSTAQVALSIAGAAIGGPLGLAGAAVLNGVSSLSRAENHKFRTGALNLVASAAVGAVGLIPGGLGVLAVAGVSTGAGALVAKGEAPEILPNLKLDEFAPKFMDKVQSNLHSATELKKPDFSGLSAEKAEKLAAQSVTSALKVCCEQLSPKIAVALARETAKEMVAPNSVEEFRYERMIAPSEKKPLGENVYLADIGTSTPAAASTQKAFLSPEAPKKYSSDALAMMLAHEQSHVENHDMVGNLGGFTLKTALRVESNNSWNPLDWIRSSSMEKKVDLAVAEISRETEFRCDREGVQKLLDLGAEKSKVNAAFQEIFAPETGSTSPTAAHPLPLARIAAIDRYLHSA